LRKIPLNRWTFERFGLDPSGIRLRIANAGAPKVLCVSLPKAGTHLLERAICLHPRLYRKLVPTITGRELRRRGGAERFFGRLRPGQVVMAHLRYDPRVPELLAAHGIKPVFMIRDPRDVVVSGYHYHLWTKERWAHLPQEKYGGQSYQQHLKGLSKDDGLLAEIERSAGTVIRDMAAWDYNRPEFLELRYETVLADEDSEFERAFRFYGFSDDAVAYALQVVVEQSFRTKTGRAVGETATNSHLRSGAPGQWREQFGPQHVERFKELAGESLVRLGYETDDGW